ncbi:hypothetical protein G9A89_006589 [Geosiphon pyriformis]|nr:hypothetical protein G9A89_006589 [Geosiphon pyriformis]
MLIGKIDDFSIEVNGIVTLIKVLVMEATQYQALVARNYHQWAHVVATMKNIRWQPSSIAAHVSSNILEDQNKWENGIIHHV